MSPDVLENIDFCIPTYNRVEYVKDLLASLPNGANVSLRDNGNFLRDVEFEFKGRLRIERDDFVVNMFENWSKVSLLGNRRWFFLASDDDVYYENLSSELEKALACNPKAGMIVFGHNNIDSTGNVLSSWMPETAELKFGKDAFDAFAYGVDARMVSILINRECYTNLGGISTGFNVTAADSELVQRLSVKYPVLFVPAVIAGYRVWSGGATHEKIATKEWYLDILLWMQKLERVLYSEQWARRSLWRRHIQHDIRLQNINSALIALPSFTAKLSYLANASYPILSRPRTHLTCALLLIKSLVRKK